MIIEHDPAMPNDYRIIFTNEETKHLRSLTQSLQSSTLEFMYSILKNKLKIALEHKRILDKTKPTGKTHK